jgi:tetratricopeptide (TPR) repeat protein
MRGKPTDTPGSGDEAAKYHQLGLTATNSGDYPKAIEYFDKALELEPSNEITWVDKGVALRALGRYEDAIQCFDRALKINIRYVTAWQNKAQAHEVLAQYKEALECYDKVLSIVPNDVATRKRKDGCIKKLRDLSVTKERALTPPVEGKEPLSYPLTDAEANYRLGLEEIKRKDYRKALEYFDLALQAAPENVDILFEKGYALHELEEYNEALTCYNKIIKLDPKHLNAWLNRGIIFGSLGQFEEAIRCYNTVLRYRPKNPIVMDLKLRCEEKLKQMLQQRQERREQVVYEMVPSPPPSPRPPSTAVQVTTQLQLPEEAGISEERKRYYDEFDTQITEALRKKHRELVAKIKDELRRELDAKYRSQLKSMQERLEGQVKRELELKAKLEATFEKRVAEERNKLELELIGIIKQKQKEMQNRFDAMLKSRDDEFAKKLGDERKKMEGEYELRLKKELDNARHDYEKRLEGELMKMEKKLRAQLESEYTRKVNDMKEQFDAQYKLKLERYKARCHTELEARKRELQQLKLQLEHELSKLDHTSIEQIKTELPVGVGGIPPSQLDELSGEKTLIGIYGPTELLKKLKLDARKREMLSNRLVGDLEKLEREISILETSIKGNKRYTTTKAR